MSSEKGSVTATCGNCIHYLKDKVNPEYGLGVCLNKIQRKKPEVNLKLYNKKAHFKYRYADILLLYPYADHDCLHWVDRKKMG